MRIMILFLARKSALARARTASWKLYPWSCSERRRKALVRFLGSKILKSGWQTVPGAGRVPLLKNKLIAVAVQVEKPDKEECWERVREIK